MKPALWILSLTCWIAVASAAEDPLASLHAGHPRLLVTDFAEWGRLSSRQENDPRLAEVLRELDSSARSFLKEPPAEYHKIGRRLLATSRTVLQRTITLGFAYRVSGNRAYAARAEEEMLAASRFPDWNPAHFLDVAEMTAALAIGYDWLNDVLTSTARTAIREAIVAKGLRLALDSKAPYNGWQHTENNWNQVCFAGLTLGALAVAEDEPELSREILSRARAGIVYGLKPYAPDGVYPEGPGYWSYGTTYQALMVAALESALGTDWDLERTAGFLSSADAYVQTIGPSGMLFDFSDGREPGQSQPALFWFARRANNPALVRAQALYFSKRPGNPLQEESLSETDRFAPLAAIWWPGGDAFSAEPRLPRYWYGRGPDPIVVFRSSWTDPNALYLALKGGSAGLSHAHMDAGSFVFEVEGVRWARDLGMQEYESLESKNVDLWNSSQESQRWSVFRLNNHSHNTLTIDDQLHRVSGSGEIVAFSDKAPSPFAIVDLSSVFRGQAGQVQRGFRVSEDRMVLIQDEIAGAKPGAKVRWAMVTGADVALKGPHAVLYDHGKRLDVQLLAPAGANFAVIPADPPKDDFNAPNPGRRILIAMVSASSEGSVEIAVSLTPGSVERATAPSFVPLKDWGVAKSR